ncbi:MAG TPA: hypothetical protein DGT23_18715 [Micromonosporaceae bacterium]|nr:hypothetical protein [Micromonosporaceae bacterium]
MPKCNIYEPLAGGINLETGKPIPPPDGRRISVGWSKDQHAQIGVGWVDPNATAESLGHQTGWSADYIMSGETDETGKIWQSQWMNLDRHTINQLIRELRRARDTAFGRDE